ncbi:MAG: glycerol-3-phosphate dehydrogenase/oxidase [Angustibacter sp.]
MQSVRDHLSPVDRARAWSSLGDAELDVLVVGGGVTGAGVALDATTRGLRVGLVEARDFASGTSSRSSKLFHGGLRYLEQLNFGLVAEALRERELSLTRLAPHLVRPVPFLYPLTRRAWERPYVAAGLALYDSVGGARSVPRQRHLSRTGALRRFPGLRRDALVGAVQYFDAQTDDARHTLTVVRTARRYGAVVRSSTEVVELVREAERVVGAVIRDVETGARQRVRARVVINATGVWTDDLQRLAGGRGRFRVRASKGVHLLVPRDRIAAECGLILRTDRSVLFVIPWGQHWIVGTTDTDWHFDLAHPAATARDLDFILDTVNSVLAIPLTRDDIIGVYAGLRPLLAGESEDTSQLSREHAVARPQPGLVSIAGGKYTTYRVMARDAVSAAAADLGPLPPSVTSRVPLVGADGYAAMVNRMPELAREAGLPVWRIEHLLGRYGSLLGEVLAPAADDPSLLRPVEAASEYLRAELRYGATHEGALHLDDLLARRTRMSVQTRHRGVDAAQEVADLVADVLEWDGEARKAEVEGYVARVRAERRSQGLDDDAASDAARREAPESRPGMRQVTATR